MGNETDQLDAAGADAAGRAATLAILLPLQRQNLLQIPRRQPASRAWLRAQPYAAWVAAEFPGLPDP
jgi:hypothetical protein